MSCIVSCIYCSVPVRDCSVFLGYGYVLIQLKIIAILHRDSTVFCNFTERPSLTSQPPPTTTTVTTTTTKTTRDWKKGIFNYFHINSKLLLGFCTCYPGMLFCYENCSDLLKCCEKKVVLLRG